jgi:hypothetical protein
MNELKFLFWNTNGNKCLDEVYNLCYSNDVDVLILAESPLHSTELLLKLNANTVDYYPQHPLTQCKKIKIFTKFHYNFIIPILESGRQTIRKITLPIFPEILLISVHMGDKSNNNSESQSENCSILRQTIEEVELSEGINHTMVIGDFNMNPFEPGIVNANGLHATMSRRIAAETSRIVNGKSYTFFYNSMWHFMGDINQSTPGTYYYKRAELMCYHWNVFDQVIIRPSLLNKFDTKNFKILDSDGVNSLITKRGIPNKMISDHLPLLFTLKL